MNTDCISWWRTSFGEEEIEAVADAIRQESVSQGSVVESFEGEVAEILGVRHVVAASNGTAALSMALMTVGVKPGDEIIVPNRTWIATAHAGYVLGARIVLADVEENRPIIDVASIEQRVTENTKAIIPVHLNGRSPNMELINEIGRERKIPIIEDSAQAFGSKNRNGYLGTQSGIGCFSLSVAKIVSSGQGGFCVTASDDYAYRMRNIRTHGVERVLDPESWGMPGFNFRFTDIHAAIARIQMKYLDERIEHCRNIYNVYQEGLSDLDRIQIIPVNIETGEVPIYSEYLCIDRQSLVAFLEERLIQCRPFVPDLSQASYLSQGSKQFPFSRKFGEQGVVLPSGPSQSLENIHRVIDTIKEGDKRGQW